MGQQCRFFVSSNCVYFFLLHDEERQQVPALWSEYLQTLPRWTSFEVARIDLLLRLREGLQRGAYGEKLGSRGFEGSDFSVLE